MYRSFSFTTVTSSFVPTFAEIDQPTVILYGLLLHKFVNFTLVFTNSDASFLHVVFEMLSTKSYLFFLQDSLILPFIRQKFNFFRGS
jgi:hypothetical protein